MQYGVCGSPETAIIAADAGYDFLESTVAALLKPLEDETAFRESLAAYRNAPLPCPVLNCFVPGSHKITGPEADLELLRDYVTTVCARAREAAVDTIVFGSGGARRIPDGFDRHQAWQQLVDFGRMTADIAANHDVYIAVEPLNLAECNVLVSVGEAAGYVCQVDHPHFRLLVDAYHWGKDNDSEADIVSAGPLFRHTHIATYENRCAPGGEPCDFGPFFQALKRGGYDGRLSVEARIGDDVATALTTGLKTMKSYA